MNRILFRELEARQQVAYIQEHLNARNEYEEADIRRQLFEPGHVKYFHYDLSNEAMVNRVISELRSVSRVESEAEAFSFIETALYDYELATQIAKWLSQERYSPTLKLSIDMGEEVGRGIDTNFQTKSTNVLSIILQKTDDACNEFGFYVKTAYPDIVDRRAVALNENYRNYAIEQLKTETNAICKGFWGLKMRGIDAYISNRYDSTKVIVPCGSKENQHQLCFTSYSSPVIKLIKGGTVCKTYRDITSLDIPEAIQFAALKAIDAFNIFNQGRGDELRASALTQNSKFR